MSAMGFLLAWEVEELEPYFLELASSSNYSPTKPWGMCPLSINVIPYCYIPWLNPWGNRQWQNWMKNLFYTPMIFFFSMGRQKIMFYSVQHETMFRKYPEKTHLSLVVNGENTSNTCDPLLESSLSSLRQWNPCCHWVTKGQHLAELGE